MTEPLTFPSLTPRHALPLLFAGQAQKEATVNAAHALADLLLHPAVEGEATAPPPGPAAGECWLVAPGATGAFAGRSGSIAGYIAGTWVFADAHDGMRAYDRASGQYLVHAAGWVRQAAPVAPTGGGTVDSQARSAIADLILALRAVGILAAE